MAVAVIAKEKDEYNRSLDCIECARQVVWTDVWRTNSTVVLKLNDGLTHVISVGSGRDWKLQPSCCPAFAFIFDLLQETILILII
jgi:hypothetical protein